MASGKNVQDVTVADSTDCARCTLWETDIGQLEKGKSYDMKMFIIREFNSKNYLSKAKDSEIVELDDIGETVSYSAELQDNSTTILSAEIVGVAELEKHKTCLGCKGRIEPLDLGLGRSQSSRHSPLSIMPPPLTAHSPPPLTALSPPPLTTSPRPSIVFPNNPPLLTTRQPPIVLSSSLPSCLHCQPNTP